MPRATETYNLQAINPRLSQELHPIKNGSLTPKDVTPGSHKKVWWQCDKGHEWEATIKGRTTGRGCPYCAGKKVSSDNCLAIINPSLAKQWHPSKNGELKPSNITPGSNRKVWWICEKGHEWQAQIASRNRGVGCPYCSNKIITEENCLATIRSDLAKEWHPTKNTKLTPTMVSTSSGRRVWWKCDKGHEWQAYISNRSRGTGCPYCANRAVCNDNSLSALFPELIKEWHPSRNGALSPNNVIPWSPKKIWWRCKYGHEWKTSIRHRTERGHKCPFCDQKTSLVEIRLFTELAVLFKGVSHRRKIDKVEADIFMNSPKLVIEFDGSYWHEDKEEKDKEKNRHFESLGISVLRIRDYGLSKIAKHDIVLRKRNQSQIEVVMAVVRQIMFLCQLDRETKKRAEEYISGKVFVNNREYIRLQRILPSPLPGMSFEDQNPQVSAEWHFTKNGLLKPNDVSPNSNRKAWWICEKGHEWQAQIASRNRGVGCPYCAGKKVSSDNCLAIINPSLAKQWHPTKNGKLTPKDVTPGSHKKVWWICEKGHEWKALIANRHIHNRGCPYCANQWITEETSLQSINPTLASEWHPSKNKPLTPRDVFPNTKKVVWWICEKGHEWEATIKGRSQGMGCPYCSCLAIINPSLAKQWHPTKNRELTPEDVTPGSGKKVWWFCDKGHEWEAVIASRNSGVGCPYCSGRKATLENCLTIINPSLAKQWHPTKNGKLAPKDVTPGSDKKVWWQCDKGHEWKARIANRNHGTGCPYCYSSKNFRGKNSLATNA